jgi:hypothetical protein
MASMTVSVLIIDSVRNNTTAPPLQFHEYFSLPYEGCTIIASISTKIFLFAIHVSLLLLSDTFMKWWYTYLSVKRVPF